MEGSTSTATSTTKVATIRVGPFGKYNSSYDNIKSDMADNVGPLTVLGIEN